MRAGGRPNNENVDKEGGRGLDDNDDDDDDDDEEG